MQKKILLVDDSDLIAGVVTEFFRDHGFFIVRARNGAEGIQAAYSEIPDVIIMDVEMPILQGYQASRLLKSRRGVKDIPIIMHTSLSEDRDKYWAMNSGANDFVTKDFDNLNAILAKVVEFAEHPPFETELIKKDALKISRDSIFEMIGTILDRHLFRSTVQNLLGDIGRTMGSLSLTISKIQEILLKVCDVHISAVLIRYNRKSMAFLRPGKTVYRDGMDDFYNICLEDFSEHFPTLDLEQTEKVILNTHDREDFNKIRMDGKKISSYATFNLIGKGGSVIGTLHLGNFTNNYFSESITENIRVFCEGAGIILENSILFRQVSEMKDRIRNVFAKFVPREIIDDMIEQSAQDSPLMGETRKVVVLFADIRSFTTICEINSAEKIVTFLNRYFDIMVNIIRNHGGIIDKFIGDAILAVFGAPKSYTDNAARAVRAAVEMIRALDEVNTDGIDIPGDKFDIGIGVHEGEGIVGTIGSSDKFDYTVIGDTVNLASRLEGLTKHYKKHIIISENVKEKIQDEIFVREVDTVKVKGKDASTAIFAVEDDPGDFPEEFMDLYEKGLMLYRMGNWDGAIQYFENALILKDGDSISVMFRDRCMNFRASPPPEWDGALALDFK